MKRILFFLTATVFALSMITCNQEELDNVQKRIDELKSDQIATISAQISSINTSITNLIAMDSELKGYITTLQGQAVDLSKADAAITNSISELETEIYRKISNEKAVILQEQKSQRDTIYWTINSLNIQIAALQAKDESLSEKDEDLQKQIEQLKQDQVTLYGKYNDLTNSIITLEASLLSQISNEKAAILQEQKSQRDTIYWTINTLNTQISALQAKDESLSEKDEDLQKQIDQLKQDQTTLYGKYNDLTSGIASLETSLLSQISEAEGRVITELNGYKTTVNNQLQTINQTIAILQANDEDLQKQINNLKNYVDSGIKSAKDWVSATFVTLEKFNQTSAIIAGIQTRIETINTTLSNLEATTYISEEDLNASILGLDNKLQGLIAQSVSDCNSALATTKKEITAAYTTAIQNAISSSESGIKTWVNNQLAGYYTIAQTDSKLNALRTSLEGQLNSQKTYLEGLISNLQTTLTNKINNNKTLIDGLQSQINSLSGDLSTLAGAVATNSHNISENAAAIASNAQKISGNAGDIDACETLIANNKQLILANETAIAANASAITALQNRATTDEQAITKNAQDIAKNASDIAANAVLISANVTAISNNAQAISDNAAAITQLHTDLATTRTEITAAYQQAIATAINTLDGQLRGELATQVNTINTRIDNEVATINATIDALTTRVSNCEKDIKNIKTTIYSMQLDIEELQEQVAAILARIQSVSYVPKYSDGKAVMTFTNNGTITPGTAEFDFELQPAATAAQIAQVWQNTLSMTAVYTITKAVPETVVLSIESVSAQDGFLTLVVSGSALKEEFFRNQCSASVRLKISDGNNERCSEYIEMVPWTTDVISFADANFKAYCVENFDTSGDREISEDEAKAVTNISASMLNISSLVGIEYFSNLETLDVSYNKLVSLDLSHSPKLTSIDVSGNKLQTLGLSGLAALKTLDCSANKLGTLDVSDAQALVTLNANNNLLGTLNISRNKALKELQCTSNNLTALDFKNNTALETIICRRNSIGQLDVTKLTGLKMLDCGNNLLASLNIYNNTALESLYCGSNSLIALSVSANTALTVVECSSNSLAALDVTRNAALTSLNCSKNNLTSLDISKNAALETVTCTGNTGLEKLWVKNAAQASALDIHKDDLTGIFYNNGGINIPDANLKTYLLALFDDDEDGEISIVESENVQNVNCSGRGIADLTGLECCTNLKYLNFANNSVAEAELPNLKKLETVVAYGNALNRINLNNDIALKALYVNDVNTNAASGTTISIDGYAQSSSLSLAVANTPYTRLEITNSTALTSLDVKENLQLTELVASGNTSVTSLDVTTLEALTLLDVNACGLTALDVSHNVELVTFDCSSNALKALDVDNNTALVTFNCSDNQLSTLRVSNNAALEILDISFNQLHNINVRQNMALKNLNVSNNTDISALALENNSALDLLIISSTSIAALDVSANTLLTHLDISSNPYLSDLNFNDGICLKVGPISRPINGLIGKSVIVDGNSAVIFSSTDKVKVILSLEQRNTLLSRQATPPSYSETDGIDNTDLMIAYGVSSPAAIFCRSFGQNWYLPAIKELKEIYDARDLLNAKLSIVNGTLLSTGSYWSSTNAGTGSSQGRYIDFASGVIGSAYVHNHNFLVRPVRSL